jgi:hypothetical protein
LKNGDQRPGQPSIIAPLQPLLPDQAITTLIGPFEKDAVDRRWPACVSINHSLDYLFDLKVYFIAGTETLTESHLAD